MAEIKIKGSKFDSNKFKELMLYIADRCSDDPDYGATKLNKILFYSDFYSYGLLGQPITGATYFKLDKGPAPKSLLPVRSQMESDGDIVIHKKNRFGKEQHRVVPLREADLSNFTAKEIAIVDQVIAKFCGANADKVSLFSHREMSWQLANIREDIPYETVFICNDPLTETEINRGLGLAKKYGWAI